MIRLIGKVTENREVTANRGKSEIENFNQLFFEKKKTLASLRIDGYLKKMPTATFLAKSVKMTQIE